MAGSTSQALTKRSTDNALMPPPPPPKRQKRPAKVLDENVYTDALSHIIARDFFPGLVESQAQQQYLTALDSNNNDWIREAGRNLAQVMTPGPDGRRRQGRGTSFTPSRSTAGGETPKGWTGATPGQTPLTEAGGDHFAPEEKAEVDVNMSLGAFQAKYTSEDNESFNSLLDKQNEKRAANYAFFHNGNKIPTNRQIAYREREQKRLESGESAKPTAMVVTNADGEERQLLTANRPSQDLATRPASVDSFPDRTGPRNTLMFGPDSVEDTVATRAQLSEMRSIAAPKATNYSGTRFAPEAQVSADLVPPSPSMSAIDAAIAGRPRPTESEPGYTGAEIPRVNGYAFVDAEPTPSEIGRPVSDAEADAAEREAALALLPKADESGPNLFTIHERSKREDVHHRLVEKADQARRKGGRGRVEELAKLGITPGRTPTPKFKSAEGLTAGRRAMTPAAKSLAEKLRTPRKGW
jgi:protein DGCR14